MFVQCWKRVCRGVGKGTKPCGKYLELSLGLPWVFVVITRTVLSIHSYHKDCPFWVFIITIKTTHFLRRNFRLTLPSPNSVRSLLSWENREKERRRSLKIFNYWVGPKNWTSLRQTCHNQASLPSFAIVVIIVPIIITLAIIITIAFFYSWFWLQELDITATDLPQATIIDMLSRFPF